MDKCSGLVAKLSKQVGDSKASLAQLEDEIQAEAGANGAQEESVREHVTEARANASCVRRRLGAHRADA